MDAAQNYWLEDAALCRSIYEIESILQTGILSAAGSGHPLFKPALVNVLICLNDLLQRAKQADKRVSFDDDVSYVFGEPKDVTTLINNFRNAVCHMPTRSTVVEGNWAAWNIAVGPVVGIVEFANRTIGACPYPGEVVVNMGSLDIFLERHVLRAYSEARQALGK